MLLFISHAYANNLFDFTQGNLTARAFQLIVFLSIIALLPFLIMVMTSFTRFIIVFSFLRSAMGTQQSPPNIILTGLSFFLTLFIMEPTFKKAYENGVKPLIEEKIKEEEAFNKMIDPFYSFMKKNTSSEDLKFFIHLSENKTITENIPLKILVPSFIIGELKKAFSIGFLIYLPFLIIDITIAAILMSLGMMMVPPAMISLPFKLIFFVAIDGWGMLCGNLLKGFK